MLYIYVYYILCYIIYIKHIYIKLMTNHPVEDPFAIIDHIPKDVSLGTANGNKSLTYVVFA